MPVIVINDEFTYRDYKYDPIHLLFIRADKWDSLQQVIEGHYAKDPTEHLVSDLKAFDCKSIQIGRGPITQCGICLTNKCQLNCKGLTINKS